MTAPTPPPAAAGVAEPGAPEVRRVDLAALAALEVDALLLWLPQRALPLAGVAGLADFALGGRLSRAYQAGQLNFAAGERALLPAAPALGARQLVCTGLGEPRALDEASVGELLHAATRAARAAGAHTLASGLPALGLHASQRTQQALQALVLRAAVKGAAREPMLWLRA